MGFFESDAKRLEREIRKRDKLQTKISRHDIRIQNRELKEELRLRHEQERLRKHELRDERIMRFKERSARNYATAKVIGGKLKSGASRLSRLNTRLLPNYGAIKRVFKK